MSNPNPPTNGFNKNPENINRGGRPKAPWTWAGLIREALEEIDEGGEQVKKKVSKSLVLKAIEGDVQALKEIGNRIDGMPKQEIDAKGDINIYIKDYGLNDNTSTQTEGSDKQE